MASATLLAGVPAMLRADGELGSSAASANKVSALTKSELLKRTGPEIWRGPELKYIGMPVGGLFAGTVYLGGDGQLWNWDIFNQDHQGTVASGNVQFMGDSLNEGGGANYVDPPRQQAPFQQHFELWTDEQNSKRVRFGDISFRGEYPVGKVNYSQADSDVEMSLVAFSPFCPLDVEASSYPATTMTFKVLNTGKQPARYRLSYSTENPAVCISKRRRADVVQEAKPIETGVLFGASARPKSVAVLPDVTYADWSDGTYGGWIATGDCFGKAPRKAKDLPSYMNPVRAGTEYVVNTHLPFSGENVEQADAHTGRLTSPEFKIARDYINMRVGGGAHPGRTCINLIVGDRIVRSVTGHDSNVMRWESVDVREFFGKTARLEVVDLETGPWGNIALGEVIFSSTPKDSVAVHDLQDFGTFCVLVPGGAEVKIGERTQISHALQLEPGQSKEVTFILAWHFPNCSSQLPASKHWFAAKWPDALAVAQDLAANWKRLRETTLAWNETWYDSTLPHWFLDRTFLNLGTLATTTCHRFADGRFYFWEGIGCCAGTCTHVWGYAQAIGRIFPEVERYLREKIDFGMAFHADSGAIDYRAEYARMVAHDGQAMCILRTYREHQMSPSDAFLKGLWPKVKSATQYLIEADVKKDGILECAQYNTLDAAWWGKISWISSLYIASLRASEAMAQAVGDLGFAEECRSIAEKGSKNIVSELFTGEYFIHKVDPSHPESNNTNVGCHIDQLFGQSWAHQVGLPRVVPQKEAVIALKSLYKYSFYDDVWDYRRQMKAIPGGRWYAVPGEPGLIMCSFPHGGAKESIAKGNDAWAVGYFNECMSGFEYQVAGHMIAEGLVKEGLSIVYAIHSRYGADKRNPYNEIECSDHYGRAMASFGAYVSLTGFHVDGPNHKMSFAPKTGSRAIKCAFVNERGWGTFERQTDGQEKVVYRYQV